MRKYGQLTDITGRPISRASSASSAQAIQERPKPIERSLTRDSDLSSSESGSDEQAEEAAQEDGGGLIPVGLSRSEDGSPRTTAEDAVTAQGQTLEHGSSQQGLVHAEGSQLKGVQPHAQLGSFRKKGVPVLGHNDSRQVTTPYTWHGSSSAFVRGGQGGRGFNKQLDLLVEHSRPLLDGLSPSQ